MKLKKCPKCGIYTFEEICGKCKKKTKDAHYKFLKIKNAPLDSSIHFLNKKKKLFLFVSKN